MPSPPPIRIRVGASIDSSIAATFATVKDQANQAAASSSSSTRRRMSDEERAAKVARKEVERTAKELEKAKRKEEAAATRAANKQIAESRRARIAQERDAEQVAQAQERSMRRMARDGARYAVHALGSAMNFAKRTMLDILHGAGVDVNLGSSVGRNVQRETLAVALSNSGFQELRPGEKAGPNNTRVDPKQLEREARAIGLQNAIDPTEVLESGRAFVGVTGNLDQSRQMMGELAKISQATTSDMTDVSKAAAKINAELGNIPNKAELTLDAVRLLAGQGKLGAVEMKDYAKYVGQISGQAGRFKGNRLDNLAELSAMAQYSVQMGFSKGAAQAATGVASFANTKITPARAAAFKAAGINNYDELSPQQLIKESLRVTGGDKLKMAKMFANVRANAMVLPFQMDFIKATGGKKDQASIQKGLDAVDAKFAHFKEGAMSQEEMDKEFAAKMNTTAAKVAQFNIKFDEFTQKLQTKLLPLLEKWGPVILKWLDKLSELDLGEVIAGIVTLAIAKGMAVMVFQKAIEIGIKSLFSAIAGMIGLGGAGGALGGGAAAALGAGEGAVAGAAGGAALAGGGAAVAAGEGAAVAEGAAITAEGAALLEGGSFVATVTAAAGPIGLAIGAGILGYLAYKHFNPDTDPANTPAEDRRGDEGYQSWKYHQKLTEEADAKDKPSLWQQIKDSTFGGMAWGTTRDEYDRRYHHVINKPERPAGALPFSMLDVTQEGASRLDSTQKNIPGYADAFNAANAELNLRPTPKSDFVSGQPMWRDQGAQLQQKILDSNDKVARNIDILKNSELRVRVVNQIEIPAQPAKRGDQA